jgi:hypothetical protein
MGLGSHYVSGSMYYCDGRPGSPLLTEEERAALLVLEQQKQAALLVLEQRKQTTNLRRTQCIEDEWGRRTSEWNPETPWMTFLRLRQTPDEPHDTWDVRLIPWGNSEEEVRRQRSLGFEPGHTWAPSTSSFSPWCTTCNVFLQQSPCVPCADRLAAQQEAERKEMEFLARAKCNRKAQLAAIHAARQHVLLPDPMHPWQVMTRCIPCPDSPSDRWEARLVAWGDHTTAEAHAKEDFDFCSHPPTNRAWFANWCTVCQQCIVQQTCVKCHLLRRVRERGDRQPDPIRIQVPFANKNAAKQHGATWDADRRTWVIPSDCPELNRLVLLFQWG